MKKLEIKKLEQTILDSPFGEEQKLINSGMAWKLEGSVGRQCMSSINTGCCMLGETGHNDYYGNYDCRQS